MPRIGEPVWLTMMSGTPEKNQLCHRFMKEFTFLMENASKNQFLPALITAVLTNHLAWVPTVMPNGQPPIKIFLEKHSSQSVGMLAKTHPYNPLWAQLGDLYGAIGSPVRLARTVVVGKRQDLFQKLFSKRSGLGAPGRDARDPDCAFSWPLPEFDPSQIRLIVYQDCERRGRNVLFDSSVKRKNEDTSVSKLCNDAQVKVFGKCCQLKPGGDSSSSLDSSITLSSDGKDQCPKYQGSRCSSDANMLGEMMFGSVAMSYKGSTLKIHQIRSPPQLMLSKVFTARTGSSICGSLNTLQDSLEFINQDSNTLKADSSTVSNGLLGNIGLSQFCSPRRAFSEQGPLRLIRSASFFAVHSNPMDMPGRELNEDRDSGIARSASLSSLFITPFPSPNSSLTRSCASSYQRRWRRSQTTSLENGVFPRWSVEESFNLSDESCGPNPGIVRKKKIAIGVIFSLSKDEDENNKFNEFFFSHFPLFESHMNKLKSAIEQAMKMSRRSADASQRSLAYNRILELFR